jgi:hypothetical protein
MKLNLLKLSGIAFLLCFSTIVSAQSTAGTMTYTFTTVKAKATGGTMTATSSGVLAVWIENAAGTYIRTGARFVGSSTSDHLPTYTLKIGGNTTGGANGGYNALSGNPGTIIQLLILGPLDLLEVHLCVGQLILFNGMEKMSQELLFLMESIRCGLK